MSKIQLFEHPEYKENKDDYETWHALYEGEQKELKAPKYLWLHELERYPQGQNLRKTREERSAYTNWAEVLVSIWTSILFRKDPQIDEEIVNLLGGQIDDVDGNGTSLTSFIRDEIVKNNFVYGTPIVRVNTLGTKPLTKADEKQVSTYRPYLEIIDPISFRDWAIEKTDVARLNKFNFVRIEYCEYADRVNARDPIVESIVSKEYVMEEGRLHVYKYRLMEDAKDKSKEKYWELVGDEVLADWDEIPISANLDGESWLKDVTPHILKYYNTESVLDNIVLFQAHQRIFFVGDFDGSSNQKMFLAEHTFNTMPTGSSVEVIPPTDLSGPENRLMKILATVFRVGLNQLKFQIEGRQVESSQTLQEVKESAISLVQAEIENIENIVNNALRLWAKFKGIQDFKGSIKFNIDDVQSDIDKASKLIMIFKDEVMLLPKMREELLYWFMEELDLKNKDELKEEVKAMIEATGDETAKASLDALIKADLMQQVTPAINEPKATK